MSFQDFLMNFEFMCICHLEPGTVCEEICLGKVRSGVCIDTAVQ